MENRPRSLFFSGSSYSSVNANIWKVLLNLASDPHPDVAGLARIVVSGVMGKVNVSIILLKKGDKLVLCGDCLSRDD